MIGILTEKPSAMRNFSKALGGNSGVINGEKYILCSSVGHVFELLEPHFQVDEKYFTKIKRWRIDTLPFDETKFMWKYGIKDNVRDVVKNIYDILKKCDEIVIATDNDPTGEGDLLAYEILIECKLLDKKITRMYFIDESINEIKKAYLNRVEVKGDKLTNAYKKALIRSKFDFLSMQFTRIGTVLTGKLLRQGRLKSAMVSIVGKMEYEVKNYKKDPFFELRFKDENNNIFSNIKSEKFKDKNDKKLLEGLKISPKEIEIIKKEIKSTPPYKLYDLAKLSSKLSNKHKAKDVLNVYQKMYEDGVVSYPRTEDKVITEEQYEALKKIRYPLSEVLGIDKKYLKIDVKRNTHVKNGGSHGANRITRVLSISEVENKYGKIGKDIYEELGVNSLLMFMEDYTYESISAVLKDDKNYKSNIIKPINLGFKEVVKIGKDEKENISKGFKGLANPFIYEGINKKPPNPTMTLLMKELEKVNVGTGATRVSTYAELVNEKQEYPLLREKKGKLSLSEYGDLSYKMIDGTKISDVKVTEQLFNIMEEVGKGNSDGNEIFSIMKQMVLFDIEVMKKNAEKLQITNIDYQKELEYVIGEYKGEGIYKNREVRFKKTFGDYVFTDEDISNLLLGNEIIIEGLKSKAGKIYSIKGKLGENEYQGRKYFGFINLGFVNNDIPKSFCGYNFTKDELQNLKNGLEIECKNCISKTKGTKFDCFLKYDDKTKKFIPRFK